MMQEGCLAGCVLAGGRSTRMGQDKALLPLGNVSLAQHAASKLNTLTPHVYILGRRPELAAIAPLIPDLRESCGPIGGMEAALSRTPCPWTLILPVDMPFLPAELLHRWTAWALRHPAAKLAFFIVDEIPQPALCLLHRDVLPFLSSAVDEGRHKLFPVLQQAAHELAQRGGVAIEETLLVREWRQAKASALFENFEPGEGTGGRGVLTSAQRAASNLWFENLNTPEQFAEAQRHLDALVDP
jgi:molybdopterin-guanine dinucleotide biosynthesis protein A